VRMYHEVKCPRVVTARNLAIGNEVVMPGLPTQQTYIAGSTTLTKINP